MNDTDLMYVASCVQDYLRMLPPSCQVAVGEKVSRSLRQIGVELDTFRDMVALEYEQDSFDFGEADGNT